MSVAAFLGLDDPNSGPLGLAQARWDTWRVDHPELAVVPEPAALRQWLLARGPDATDPVLAALANLGNYLGGDEIGAATVLCWVLLPGATTLAIRLRPLSPDVDQVVASQLWLEVRSGRPPARRVSANILMNTSKGVHRQLGVGKPVGSRYDRATPVDPTSRLWHDLPSPHRRESAAAELNDLLEQARAEGVINLDDCRLLIRLAYATDNHRDKGPRCARRGGLVTRAATTAVSADLGVSARTVRRRVQRSLDALAEAYASEKRSA